MNKYLQAPAGAIVVGTIVHDSEEWIVYLEPTPQQSIITARSLRDGRERSAGRAMDSNAGPTNRKLLSSLFDAIYHKFGWYDAIAARYGRAL